MRTLGLIGGISWVSTIDYYRYINTFVNDALGGLNYSQCIVYSFNYADIKKNNENNDWESTLNLIADACENLKRSGAEGIVLCASTMHLIADELEARIQIPVIHIASATGAEICRQKIKKIGLLGTRFTMERDFFKAKLTEQGIETIIPNDSDRAYIHHVIFEEFGRGIFLPETKKRFQFIMQDLVNAGAEGIVLGCTEIPLLLRQTDFHLPLFDTTQIHSKAAVDFALNARIR